MVHFFPLQIWDVCGMSGIGTHVPYLLRQLSLWYVQQRSGQANHYATEVASREAKYFEVYFSFTSLHTLMQ